MAGLDFDYELRCHPDSSNHRKPAEVRYRTDRWRITKCRFRQHVWHVYGPETGDSITEEEYEYYSGADALRAYKKGCNERRKP